jgi:hypothetical protein
MAIVVPDSVATLEAIVGAWNVANTDSTPIVIDAKEDKGRIATTNNDTCLIYPLTEKVTEIGLTRDYVERHDTAVIQICTVQSRAHMMKMKSEVERLIYVAKFPTASPTRSAYHLLRPQGWERVADYKNFWNYELTVELVGFWESRS